jgi:hypothetical protein
MKASRVAGALGLIWAGMAVALVSDVPTASATIDCEEFPYSELCNPEPPTCNNNTCFGTNGCMAFQNTECQVDRPTPGQCLTTGC